MGRKPFVSKSTSTKYDLLFSSTQDASTAPEREWVESSRHVGIGKPDAERLAKQVHEESISKGRYPVGHPLAWLEEEAQPNLSEDRRQEIIRLGFPDDGYDYLQHMRRGQGSSVTFVTQQKPEEITPDGSATGPSHFVPAPDFQPPPADYKAIDASRLTIHQAPANEDEASLLAGGASGFSRELQTVRKRHQREIDDLEALMRQFECNDGIEGDLLEDFVLSATEAAGQNAAEEITDSAQRDLYPDGNVEASPQEDEDESGEEFSSEEEDGGLAAPSEVKSFASTYWRPERHDRRGDLSVIDERFEQVAPGYDSDEIGELDQDEADPSLSGVQNIDRYTKVLDQFLAVHNTQDHAHDSGHAYDSAAQTSFASGKNAPQSAASRQLSRSEATAAEQEAAVAALAKAKELLKRLQEEDAAASSSGEEGGDGTSMLYDDRPRENWDCESILTSRSTAYNHPKRLDDLSRRRGREGNGRIQLSQKTGLPVLSKPDPVPSQGPALSAQEAAESTHKAAAARKPDESQEEKRQRKGAVKEAKRQARANKKELKLMFRDAAQQQQRQTMPNISVTSLA